MNNFEIHQSGTSEEIRLSRRLAREIESIEKQYPGVVPQNVMSAYLDLKRVYDMQLDSGDVA